MDVQWLSRIRDTPTSHYLEEQHQISLWSESWANVLSLWSVLFVESFLYSCITLVPLGLYFALLHWLPNQVLADAVNVIYVDIALFINNTIFLIVGLMLSTRLFGRQPTKMVFFRGHLQTYLAIILFMLPFKMPIRSRVVIQRIIAIGYLIAYYYVHRVAVKQKEETENRAQNVANPQGGQQKPLLQGFDGPLILDGTTVAICKALLVSFVAFGLMVAVMGIYWNHGQPNVQLFIRLVVVTGIFFIVDFLQIYFLIDLSPEHMERRMEMVLLVNGYSRMIGRFMICTVDEDNFSHSFMAMCFGTTVLEIFNRSTYNYRYHVAKSLKLWTGQTIEKMQSFFRCRVMGEATTCTGFLQNIPTLFFTFKKKLHQSYAEGGQDAHSGAAASSASSKARQIHTVYVGSQSPSSHNIPEDFVRQKRDIELNRVDEEVEEDSIPFPLPSPLREMRMSQIVDNVASDLRGAIIAPFILYFAQSLYKDMDFHINYHFFDCIYQVGVQVLFQFVSELFSLHVDIYVYKMPLDINYDKFRGSMAIVSLYTFFTALSMHIMISASMGYHLAA